MPIFVVDALGYHGKERMHFVKRLLRVERRLNFPRPLVPDQRNFGGASEDHAAHRFVEPFVSSDLKVDVSNFAPNLLIPQASLKHHFQDFENYIFAKQRASFKREQFLSDLAFKITEEKNKAKEWVDWVLGQSKIVPTSLQLWDNMLGGCELHGQVHYKTVDL